MNEFGNFGRNNLVPKETLLPYGSTALRIKSFTPNERVPLQETDAPFTVHPESKSATERIKQETIQISFYFIPEVWESIKQWVAENPPGFMVHDPKNPQQVVPVTREEFLEKTRNSDGHYVLDMINEYTRHISRNRAFVWKEKQEEKLSHSETLSPEERGRVKVYERYKGVLSMGKSNVRNEKSGKSEILPDRHLDGGFSTGRTVILSSFGVLEPVFVRQFGRKPTPEEHKKLLIGIKSIALAIAQSHVLVSSLVLDKSRGEIDPEEVHSPDQMERFDPDKFSLSMKGDSFGLEIQPHVLDAVEDMIKKIRAGVGEYNTMHMGCPALFVKGSDGKNIIVEQYDWYAKLFEEFYIDRNKK